MVPVTQDALDIEFVLDTRVVEAAEPHAELLRSTSDNCGSTCQGTACTSFTDDPAPSA
ncbi:FxLD family lanthipeptide [Polymorphospora sp. NPDC051019]|uniref:FxLD family lanthipeptide n=1 Tax=Polymorphospora TaxID=338583 RepID=UPI0033C0092B